METISLEEFKKIDLRIGRVVAAERVEGAKKLLALRINLGNEEKGIVSGIGEKYEPDSLIGREIVLVYNLEPKDLMGVTSEGMLLAASGGDFISILQPDREVPPGSKVH